MFYPRLLLAAGASGSGKTLITCGILQALKNRNLEVSSFKCGPDYIDPMFHSNVIHTKARNLDTFFTDRETTTYLFTRAAKGADISILEGVMGFYDGLGGISTKASAYDLANTIDAPVVFIVNGKGMSVSLVAYIKGFLEYKSDHHIKGIILNQVSSTLYTEIKSFIEKELDIQVYGYVPKIEEYLIESRHLGLVLPDEVIGLKKKLNGLASILEETVDIDGLIELANKASELEVSIVKQFDISCLIDKKICYDEKNRKKGFEKDIEKYPLRIAVARDSAFCFIYEDNLELLKQMGAELVEFSPMKEKRLPLNIHGILLYGGYPELFAKELSENKEMIQEIYTAIKSGMPCLAECGGFMYLHQEMEDMMGKSYSMVGIVEGKCYKTERLKRFGYIELEAKKQQMFGMDIGSIKGHEFHYFDSTSCGDAFEAKKPLRNRTWNCIYGTETLIAGFPHFYYYSNLKVPERFLDKCMDYASALRE